MNMISFYVDPQWCGVLFSVYWRNEKGCLFTGGITPQLDPLAATAFAEPVDVEWITFAGSVGLEIYHLSSSWAFVFDAAKVTGVLLLLGFGSLVGYKIFKYLWLSRFSDHSEPPSPSTQNKVTVSVARDQLLEDVEGAELNDVEGKYFGPCPAPGSIGVVGMLCMHLHKLTNSLSGIRKSNINICLESFCTATPCKLHNYSRGIQQKIISQHDRFVPENCIPFLLWLQESCPCPHDMSPSDAICDLGWLVKKIIALEDFQAPYMHRKYVNEFLQQTVPGIRNIARLSEKSCANPQNATSSNSVLPRYCNEDAYDFSAHMHREGSFDSTCSEFSLDFTLPESCENTNIINMDKLQQEIDKLKSNCQMMDEELEIIKCNRNLPGLSSLMETNVSEINFVNNDDGLEFHSVSSEALKQKTARACFAGLYSLTTIKNSSSDLSDVSESGNKMIDSTESLDWDSPQCVVTYASDAGNKVPDKIFSQPHRSSDIDNCTKAITERESKYVGNQESSSQSKSSINKLTFSASGDEMTLDLEWDEDDLASNINIGDENYNVDLAGEQLFSEPTFNTEINNLIFQHTMCKDNQYNQYAQNVMNGNTLQPNSPQSQDWSVDCVMNTSKCSKESGYLECDEETEFLLQESDGASSAQSSPESDAPTIPNSSDAIYMPNVQYVGSRMNIYKYVLQVCQESSKQDDTLIKGFVEIPSLTGMQNLRQVHGDCYCVIRATIFLSLLNHCPIPSGRSAFQSLSEAFNNYNFTWLRNWDFSLYLPYKGNEVLHGMRMCLHTLDNLISVLSSKEDAEDTLALLLNSDRSLDVHIMEAVKLHLVLQAIKLYQSYTSGGSVPPFAEFMFGHESCRNPKEFMYKHLQNMGKSTDFNDVMMSMLGYTLNMKMCIINPVLFGTDQFVSYFPQCDISSPHEVVLIEVEDCYSILVK